MLNTATGETILVSHIFLPMKRDFIYPVTSAAKSEAFGQRIIRMRSGTHGQKVGVWWAISRNRRIGLHQMLGTFLRDHFCPFTGHWNEDETDCGYLQRDGATAHTPHVPMTLLCSRSEKFKRTFSHHNLPTSHSLIISCGQQWKAQFTKTNLQSLLELKEDFTNLTRNWLVAYHCKQDKMRIRVSMSTLGSYLRFVVT